MTKTVSRPRMRGYGNAVLAGEMDKLELAGVGGRNPALFAAACAVGRVVAGGELSADYARSRLVEMGVRIGLSRGDVERQVRRGFAKGEETPRRAPERGVRLQGRMDAQVAVFEWWEGVQRSQDHKDPTTMKVLAGFAVLAMSAGKMRISDSYRQVAEAAGVSVSTIHKHRCKLAPWVRAVSIGSRVKGERTEWQLVNPQPKLLDSPTSATNTPALPVDKASGLFPKGVGGASGRELDDPSHDQWHRWAGGWRIYNLLSADEELTARELAKLTGRSLVGVRRILCRLRHEGLIEFTGTGWVRVVAAEAQPGMIPWSERRKERHAQDRRSYRRWQADLMERLQQRRRRRPGQEELPGVRAESEAAA